MPNLSKKKMPMQQKKPCIICGNIYLFIAIAVIVLLIGFFWLKIIFKDDLCFRSYSPVKQTVQNRQNSMQNSELSKTISVSEPMPGSLISSPLTIAGQATGSWYFEGDFPIKLTDSIGNIIAEGYLSAQGDWMTENKVPFKGTLEFKKPAVANGILILSKDNPSDLDSNAGKIEIPVIFK